MLIAVSLNIMSKPSFASKIKETNHKAITILRCKVVIVGDGAVGKSALTQVFCSGGSGYPKAYMMVSMYACLYV